jgi:hypothetical protein
VHFQCQVELPELYKFWRYFDVAHIDAVVSEMYNKLPAFMTHIRTLLTELVYLDILSLVGFCFEYNLPYFSKLLGI